jgi:ubiquinone/menaquinone biosynthesis C-methylase UbiE
VLDRVALQPGMSCVDVGAGPGAVMRLMADRVGPNGLVTGIEIDPALGADALRDLRAGGGARFDLISADVLKLEAPTQRAIRSQLLPAVLMHQRDPVAVLEKMV